MVQKNAPPLSALAELYCEGSGRQGNYFAMIRSSQSSPMFAQA
jgi:hypothetical protein